MKIALLGGAGRVGSWVTPWLQQEHEVLVLDAATGDGVIPVDALDRESVRAALGGVDALVHLCAIVPRGPLETKDPGRIASAWAVNVGSVAQSMLACADAGVPRFLHVSTLSVFARAGIDRLDPTATTDSHETYGLSKRTAESLCATLAQELGIDAVSLRLGWPTPDDVAPLWLQPATGSPTEVKLSDGTVVSAIGGQQFAGMLIDELRRPLQPGHAVRNAVADASEVFHGLLEQ